MHILNLPVEILLIIFKMLDFMSQKNLYYTGNNHIKNIVCMHDTVKQCHLSLSTLATAKSLNLNFVRDISRHLLELNMCAVQDLSKTLLIRAIKKMKCLITLNISYTKIEFVDLIDIYQACPTIKNISINFIFRSAKKPMTEEVVIKFQNIFENMENVHFVGSRTLYMCRLPFILLQKANLNNLKYTFALEARDWFSSVMLPPENVYIARIIQFKRFVVYMTDLVYLPYFTEYCEYLVFQYCEFTRLYRIHCSNILEKFCLERFGELVSVPDNTAKNIFVTIYWNRHTTVFDNIFFSNLDKELDQLLPLIRYSKAMDPNQKSNQPFFRIDDMSFKRNNNWFLSSPNIQSDIGNMSVPHFKKVRIVSKPFILDYDEVLRGHHNAELCINFCSVSYRYSVSLSEKNIYLKNLTLLSLRGYVRYNDDFFQVLFQSCDKLVTLHIEAPATSPCAVPISKSIHLSRSIKNFHLTEKAINFNKLFSSLYLCQTLENVHIYDMSLNAVQYNDIANTDLLLEKCNNLYCLVIVASMTETTRAAKTQNLNKAKLKYGRNYLHVKLLKPDTEFHQDPYNEVFRIIPFKPIK